jgi:diguanylate cyclase (GGDEF)-like protein
VAHRSLGITSRFALVVVVLIPSLAAVAWVGFRGMQSGRSTADSLYSDHLVNIYDASTLETALQAAELDSVQLLTASVAAERDAITADLLSRVSPEVSSSLMSVASESANDPAEQPRAAAIAARWSAFQHLLASGALVATNASSGAHVTDSQLTAILGAATAAASSIIGTEDQQADQAHTRLLAEYGSNIRWMLFTVSVALLAMATVVGWLIRSVLPRTLAYSAFAADVTRGDYSKRLDPTGNDELTDLGRTLDELARSRQAEDLYDHHRSEFTDALQVAETEQEAHELVKRHLERSVHQGTVTVLNRNNSADRLHAVTAVGPASPLALGLEVAKPRSCLAVRLARPHQASNGEEALLSCSVCSQCPGQVTCTPLLVGGEVIGSILAEYQQPLTDREQRSIREVVVQSAPVLGNLRNLAIAELRAATDSLTGLPNKRGMQDTVKRMVAQSLRAGVPLTALMCDLDHFKSINDRFGHGRGDEVLAAVGAVFGDTLRAGDFAGRYGGEEFLVLLPEAGDDSGLLIAERIRAGVAALRIGAVDQPITISIGLAVIPDHSIDSETLLRAADGALYAAKNGGRNRTEISSLRASSPDFGQAQARAADQVAAE